LILEDAPLHHDTKKAKPEDEFQNLLEKAAKKGAAINAASCAAFAHDKIFNRLEQQRADQSIPPDGTTNFSVTRPSTTTLTPVIVF
jgi:hypothetical protein